jgi:protein-L-isoaspartate(D-aspartate) O-methyltransferase
MSMSSRTLADAFPAQRQNMVEAHLRGRGISDERVLRAFDRVPRHEFVPERHRGQAYEDHPLPLAEGQTISQPYIVGITLEALALQPSDRVLEIGTGSGYQTALVAELTKHVYSMERQESLAREAAATLARLGYTNVTVLVGDGSQGLPEQAPFDAIVVSAAAPRVPIALFEQLREGGRMVVPVGPHQAQQLQLVGKENGDPVISSLGGCSFVPLIGGQGYISGW